MAPKTASRVCVTGSQCTLWDPRRLLFGQTRALICCHMSSLASALKNYDVLDLPAGAEKKGAGGLRPRYLGTTLTTSLSGAVSKG